MTRVEITDKTPRPFGRPFFFFDAEAVPVVGGGPRQKLRCHGGDGWNLQVTAARTDLQVRVWESAAVPQVWAQRFPGDKFLVEIGRLRVNPFDVLAGRAPSVAGPGMPVFADDYFRPVDLTGLCTVPGMMPCERANGHGGVHVNFTANKEWPQKGLVVR